MCAWMRCMREGWMCSYMCVFVLCFQFFFSLYDIQDEEERNALSLCINIYVNDDEDECDVWEVELSRIGKYKNHVNGTLR